MPISVSPIEPTTAPPRQRTPRIVARHWHVEILLVDDDAADRSLILDVLWRDARVRDVQALDAPDTALFQLAAGKMRPNLILLDIHMPRVNGFKFLEALREIPAMKETPVVFLTTSRLPKDVARAKDSSASSYLVKPDSYTDLKARLTTVIDQVLTGQLSR